MLKIIFFPITLAWMLAGFIFGLLGRLITAVFALILMAVGVSLTLTLIAAFLGIPLLLLGGVLLIRAIF